MKPHDLAVSYGLLTGEQSDNILLTSLYIIKVNLIHIYSEYK